MITLFNYLTIYCEWGKVDKAEAIYEDGVLTLTLPKAKEAKPKQIKVEAKQIAEGKKAEAKI